MEAITDAAAADVLKVAANLHTARPSWALFFREVLGVDGICRQVFKTPDAMQWFRERFEYQKILDLLQDLRDTDPNFIGRQAEPTRVITVRLPKSIHELLRAEAHERHTSMNRLCVGRLIGIDSGPDAEQEAA